jgi:hypothetical protein
MGGESVSPKALELDWTELEWASAASWLLAKALREE